MDLNFQANIIRMLVKKTLPSERAASKLAAAPLCRLLTSRLRPPWTVGEFHEKHYIPELVEYDYHHNLILTLNACSKTRSTDAAPSRGNMARVAVVARPRWRRGGRGGRAGSSARTRRGGARAPCWQRAAGCSAVCERPVLAATLRVDAAPAYPAQRTRLRSHQPGTIPAPAHWPKN